MIKKFNCVVLGAASGIEISDIDQRDYVKYLLREGTIVEKRELLRCLRSRIVSKD